MQSDNYATPRFPSAFPSKPPFRTQHTASRAPSGLQCRCPPQQTPESSAARVDALKERFQDAHSPKSGPVGAAQLLHRGINLAECLDGKDDGEQCVEEIDVYGEFVEDGVEEGSAAAGENVVRNEGECAVVE
jgi:hypothetical protein